MIDCNVVCFSGPLPGYSERVLGIELGTLVQLSESGAACLASHSLDAPVWLDS